MPDDRFHRLAESAGNHGRSLPAEAVATRQSALDTTPTPASAPPIDDTLAWLEREVWYLRVQDRRSDDDILEYRADGLCD